MNLSKSNKLNATKEGSLPEDLAFLAMTQHQLGKKDEAKTTLGRLRISRLRDVAVSATDRTGWGSWAILPRRRQTILQLHQ